MQRSASRRVVVGLGLSGLLLFACARASMEEATDDLAEQDGSGGTSPSGGNVDAGPPKPSPTTTTTTPVPPPPTPEDDGGADAEPPVVDAGPPDAPPPAPTCDFKNECPATVTKIGTVSGNLTTKTVTASGATSEWIQVAMNDEGFVWGALKLRVKLTAPAGAQYGLLAYEAAPAATACTAPKKQDLGTDAVKTMDFEWGNGLGDDGKSMTFEVRRIAGACDATKTWKLEVTGAP